MLPMALLLVSKTIYEEASFALFSRNTFVLPTWQFMEKFFAAFEGKVQLAWITKLELSFTPSDLHTGLPGFARAAHPHLLDDIVDIWSQKARWVLSSTRCQKIKILMDDAQCVEKCFRFDANATWTLKLSSGPQKRAGDDHSVLPRQVRMEGLPDRLILQRVLKDIGGHYVLDTPAHS